MDVIYDRQKEIGINPPQSVAVIGCGGLGFWVASALCLCGVPKLKLLEGDKLELSNLNRLMVSPERVGENKAEVLKEILAALRPELQVSCCTSMATPDLLEMICEAGDVIVDCTDDFEFQKRTCLWAKGNSYTYVRVGLTTDHVTVTSSVPDWTLQEPKRVRCGEHVPAWVAPCMVAAAYAVEKIVRDPKLELSFQFNRETVPC